MLTQSFSKVIRRFRADAHGTFALKTALISPLMLIAVGIAIDYSRMSSAASDLQDAADAAAITGAAAMMRVGEGEWQDDSQKSLDENVRNFPNLSVETVNVSATERSTVRVEAFATLEPMFPQIMGYPRYEISRVSEATYGSSGRLELAIVLDTTNSMANTSAWSTAVTTLENMLEDMQGMTGQNNFFVTLIPFQNYVNVGTHRRHWLSGTVPVAWNGCVDYREERIGAFEWAMDDDNYAVDPIHAQDTGKFTNRSHWNNCSVEPIAGPTNNMTVIASAARGMNIDQTGRFDEALVWGWRAVSPKWAGRWSVPGYPSAYGDSRKVVVFMTDGNSAIYEYTMSEERDLGNNNGTTVAFQHLEDLCTRMKDEGIELFMLRLPGNDHIEPYMRRCATSPSHYLEASTASELPRLIGVIRDGMRDELRLIR